MRELKIEHITPYLPYNLKFMHDQEVYDLDGIFLSGDVFDADMGEVPISNIKPLLRSFDTFTAEELKEVFPHYHNHGIDYLREEVCLGLVDVITFNNLLKRHIDVFNLINFDLALEK